MPSEYSISQFIDDELDLTEKEAFVHDIRSNADFAEETLAMVRMEKMLRSPVTESVPVQQPPARGRGLRLMPILRIAALFAAVVAASVFGTYHWMGPAQSVSHSVAHRFVVYLPDAESVDIAGTFTEWRRVPLRRLGASGYWEINMKLTPGEHRFSYIVGDDRSIADPTVVTRETDDFGGVNSVIVAGDRV